MEKAPVFVKVDEYQDIVDIISLMREKVKQSRFLLDKIGELRAQQDREFAAWIKDVDEVDSRVSAIERTLSRR